MLATKPTIKQLSERAGLRLNDLAKLANLSPASVSRMANKKPVSESTVALALYVINQRLGTDYTPQDVDVQLIS